LGHIKRSLLLAKELIDLGAEVTFAADALDKTGMEVATSAGFDITRREDSQSTSGELVVVDGYNFVIEKIKADHPASRVIVFEDYCHRSFSAEMVIDANYATPDIQLSDCGIEAEHWVSGPQFTIVNKSYWVENKKRNNDKTESTDEALLLSLGAGDIDGLSIEIFEAFYWNAKFDLPKIDFLPGPYFPQERLEYILERYQGNIGELHKPRENLADIYARYQFAIGAAGTSAYERLASGIFSLNIIGNDNQERVGKGIEYHGSGLTFDARREFDHGAFLDLVRKMKTPKPNFQSAQRPDGLGQNRIARAIIRSFSKLT
jgi:spore coat polysaccharide biosynthesis predicted glycosyltransferase SpsG